MLEINEKDLEKENMKKNCYLWFFSNFYCSINNNRSIKAYLCHADKFKNYSLSFQRLKDEIEAVTIFCNEAKQSWLKYQVR